MVWKIGGSCWSLVIGCIHGFPKNALLWVSNSVSLSLNIVCFAVSYYSDTVDHSWQFEKFKSWHWWLVTDSLRMAWTAFATLRYILCCWLIKWWNGKEISSDIECLNSLTFLKRVNTKIQDGDLPAGIAKRSVARSARAKLNKSVGQEGKINAK